MGGLIQTKGTQVLLNLLNSRFGPNTAAQGATPTGIIAMRAVAGLLADFAPPTPPIPSGPSLLDISDDYVGEWPDGSDLFFPTATVTNGTANNSRTVNFSGPLPAFVQQANTAATYQAVWGGQSAASNIPPLTMVTNINTVSQLTLNNPITITPPQPMIFSNPKHPNLIKRWKFYLKNELLPAHHLVARTAISQALANNQYQYILFQTIESNTQQVITSTEYASTPNGANLDLAKPFMNIILMTPRTNAPDPIDPQ